MSVVQGTNATTSAATTTNTKSSSKNMVSKDDFLKILVAQLKYQNPLDPQDPSEFLTQLSQLSQVEQLNNIASSLEEVGKANTTSQWVSAIGKKVNADSSLLTKGDQVILSPQTDYDTITLGIKDLKDGSTKTVTFNKGDTLSYTYDGDNTIQIGVTATKDGQEVTCNAMVLRVVKGIAISDTGTMLVLGNDETVDASTVKVIKE
jgi:flagellar basal-body rod modification protein FlgD